MNMEKIETDNIFDLTKLIPIENSEELKKESSKIQQLDQNKLLNGYTEVPRADWDKIPKQTHIRYLRKDGNFRKGGYVLTSWIDAYGKNKGKNSLQLANNLSYRATKWSIVLEVIDKIWQKNKSANIPISNESYSTASNSTNNLQHIVTEHTESIEQIRKTVDLLKTDLVIITNEQKRIINLIKKLHNIKTTQ